MTEQSTDHRNRPTSIRIIRTLNKSAPILTIVAGALTFLAGFAFNAYTEKSKAQEAKEEQWRLALEKVGFDESSLLPTAYLMDSFGVGSAYHDQARAVEAGALLRTNDPHKFDLMFAVMLRHTTDADQIELVRTARTLSLEMKGLYSQSPSKNSLGFNDFLMRPKDAYKDVSSPGSLDEYNRVLVLLWEIDSYSQGFQCSWTHDTRCTPLTPPKDLSGILLFNHPLPDSILSQIPPSERPQSYNTCSVIDVNTTPKSPGLTCEATAPAKPMQ